MTKTEISALFDGELEQDEIAHLVAGLHDAEGSRESFRLYGMVGDVLRGELPQVADISGRVMASIENETLVFLPRKPRRWQRPLLAVAASVAGVAVVAAVALMPQRSDLPPAVVALSAPSTDVQNVASVESGLTAGDLREFLIAHQTHSLAGTFSGGPQQVRTVSLVEQRGGR